MDEPPLPPLPLTHIKNTTRNILSTLINNVKLREEINLLRNLNIDEGKGGQNNENAHSTSPCRKRRKLDARANTIIDVNQLISDLSIDKELDLASDLLLELIDQFINEFNSAGDVDLIDFENRLSSIPKHQIKSWKIVSNISLSVPPKVLDFLVRKSFINIPQLCQILAKNNTTFKQFLHHLTKSSYSDLVWEFVESVEGTPCCSLLYSSIILNNKDLTLFDKSMSDTVVESMRASYEDVLCLMLREQDDIMIQFQNLLKSNSDQDFQNSIAQFVLFSLKVSQSDVIQTMKKMIDLCKVNVRNFLIVWFAVLRRETDQSKMDKYHQFLSDLIKESISSENSHNFILSLLLLRVFDLTGKASYLDLYQKYFGSNGCQIHSSKSVSFILKTNISLVPYELGHFLKHKIKIPIRGNSKYKELHDEYMLLAKTRMRDFSQIEVDSTIISEVNKCIESFRKKNSIPTSILEASIFKKQYYTNNFLPALLYSSDVNIEGRDKLIAALKAARKIPQSLLDRKNESIVMELSSEDVIRSLIESVRVTNNIENVRHQLLSKFSSVKLEKDLVSKLLTSVIERGENVLQFIKSFLAIPDFQDVFDAVVGSSLSESLDIRFVILLQLCMKPETLIKDLILSNKSKCLPILLNQEFYHVKVLGLLSWTKVSDDVPWECEGLEDYTGHCIAWSDVDVSMFCRTLEWWPVDYILLLQVSEYAIQQIALTQPSHKLCFTIFSTILTSSSSLLPLLTPTLSSLLPSAHFTKLWVYEALAKVLLPLYQTKTEKPVHVIRTIFSQFFSSLQLIKPTLLLKSGNIKKTDNLSSVLGSYKMYITNHKFLFELKILNVICKSFTEERQFTEICRKSPTFVLSCAAYFDKLKSFSLIGNDIVILGLREIVRRIDSGEKVKEGVPMAGVLLQNVKITQNVFNCCESDDLITAYLYSSLHSLSSDWLSGRLRREGLSALGAGIVRCEGLVERAYKGAVSQDVLNHFSGYRSSKVFPLTVLGALACSEVDDVTPVTLSLCKTAYPQAQKLIFDRSDIMSSMQKYVTTFTRSNHNDKVLATTFVNCLTAQ